jgi:MarR family transcriptional regulator, transcriptional regulator for hemolysin
MTERGHQPPGPGSGEVRSRVSALRSAICWGRPLRLLRSNPVSEAKPTESKPIDIEPFEIYHLVVTPSDEPIGLFVTRTARTLSRAFDDVLVEHGSSLPSWVVMASLAGGLHPSQRSIAAAVGVEGPTLTHHLNRMETSGLVTRTRDPQNRRAHQVELTADGKAAFLNLLDPVQGFDRRLRAGFTADELATLRELLRRLADNVAGDHSTQKEKQ